MPNVRYGRRTYGLLLYLWGPGKANEHEAPHLVAGYDVVRRLSPDQHPEGQRWGLSRLSALLDAPHVAAGERAMQRHVWHCSLALPPDEGPLEDETWAAIARRFVEGMGFAGDADRAGCRWIAMRHGTSAKGNDHIHLVVTLATEDGAPVWLRQDKKHSQEVADMLEDEFGLIKRARRDTRTRRGAPRPEVEQARASGRDATDREVLRREVRAALAGARNEAEWVATMREAGLLVAPRTDAGRPDKVVGYAVALPPAARSGKPRWLAGRTVDPELSLARIRGRWPSDPPLNLAGWKAATRAERQASRMNREQRIETWRHTTAVLADITTRLAQVPSSSAQWPGIARASADLLAQTAAIAEPSGFGPLSRAADALSRAAAPRRRDPMPVAGTIAVELARAAAAIRAAGSAQSTAEAGIVLALVVQTARLVVALADLRIAQDQAAAAGAAALAAARLMPVLRLAQPSPPAPAPLVDRAGATQVTPALGVPAPHR